MLNRLKSSQKIEFKNKLFKTDKLIQLQIDYILSIEKELNSRKTGSFLNDSNAYQFDIDFDREILELKNLQIQDLEDEQLNKLYTNNLIKYYILKKLNSELEFARVKLQLSTRTQINLDKIRQRVSWLENQIELICEPVERLERDKIESIRRERTLLIEQSIIKENSEVEPVIEKAPETNPQYDEEEEEEVFFRWEKSSNGSTDSLLVTPSPDDLETEMIQSGQQSQAPLEEVDLVELVNESVKYEDFKTEEYDQLRELNPSVTSIVSRVKQSTPEPVEILEDKLEESKNVIKKSDWLSIHNRFDYADYSKVLIALNSGSFHRLPLAITESYINIQNAKQVDGRVPQLEGKHFLEFNDHELIKIAKDLKSLSKEICSATELSVKKDDSNHRYNSNENHGHNRHIKRIPVVKDNKYEPKPLLPPAPLPLKMSKHKPRTRSAYTSHEHMKEYYRKTNLINLHDLKKQTKLSLMKTNGDKNGFLKRPEFLDENDKEEDEDKPKFTWNDIKPDHSPERNSGLRFERVKYLININLKSSCQDQKIEAIKHLGLLKSGDSAAIYNLAKILENTSENEITRYESAKSLVLLGYWNLDVFKYINDKLSNASVQIKQQVLECILKGKNCLNIQDDLSQSFDELIHNLERLSDSNDIEISLKSCLCIGQLGIRDNEKAINKLIYIYENNSDWDKKSQCLESLVRLFHLINSKVINFIIHAVHSAPSWTARAAAVKLLSHIGANVLNTFNLYDKIYELLSIRLSDDPIKEVRVTIGNSIRDLQMIENVFQTVTRNLENTDEEIRAKSVISIEMLGIRKKKTISTLVDMLELDSSEFVRTTVLKALTSLAPRNPKVIQAFNNLEKNSKIYKIMMRMNESNF